MSPVILNKNFRNNCCLDISIKIRLTCLDYEIRCSLTGMEDKMTIFLFNFTGSIFLKHCVKHYMTGFTNVTRTYSMTDKTYAYTNINIQYENTE